MALTPSGYRPRIADRELEANLKAFGAVCIEGPKWCGKTWTALNAANSVFYVGSPNLNFQNRMLAIADPERALSGDAPHLIDEWQEAPSIWDAVRFEVDKTPGKGRFILTGSATPKVKGILHTGTGRFGALRMRTMSLFESGDSSGSVSLRGLFDKKLKSSDHVDVSLEQLVDLTVRGGWPGALDLGIDEAMKACKRYLELAVNADISAIDGIYRDSRKMSMLIRSLARNESSVASNETIRKDMLEYDDDNISITTMTEYIDILKRLFLYEEQPAFDPNMRSSVGVGKHPKRHLVDPSLSVAALNATPDMLIDDLKTYGHMFEAMCIRDLRIYTESFSGQIGHYRDRMKREIDATVKLPDGRWGAFEVKLGTNQFDDAANKLLKLKVDMESDPNAKPPSVLGIICGLSSYAYCREDGVNVIPITMLRD